MARRDVPGMFGGGPCFGGGRGRGRGRGRMFESGDLRLIVMQLLADRPRHGYEIIKALEERVGGGYSPSPGVVYPTLTLLEELGHATVSEERAGRRLYALTEEGRTALEASRSTLDAILARLAEGPASRGGLPPRIVRAMENLATAVRLRFEGREVSDAEIRAIAAAIDRAAGAVEEV
ncbi:MAG: PadR family transcriptional regulator [Geminicoccaceae bacterium]